jgi:hypothetical protein
MSCRSFSGSAKSTFQWLAEIPALPMHPRQETLWGKRIP